MDILIVDDEHLGRARLVRLANDLGYTELYEASNATQAWEIIQTTDPEVVLLDIEMPGENGIELAKKISELDQPPAIIFTTAYDQYALEAFNTIASGYCLKPVQKDQLEAALKKAGTATKLIHNNINKIEKTIATENKTGRQHITSKGHRGVDLIPIVDIRLFMADQKYVQVISSQGLALIDEPLKELEQEFAEYFIRIHRNALIAVKHIQGLERDGKGHYIVKLAGIEEKPLVSRRYTTKIKQLLASL